MKKTAKFNIVGKIILGAVGILFLALFLHLLFTAVMMLRQYSNSKVKLDAAIERVQKAEVEMHMRTRNSTMSSCGRRAISLHSM